ncbi:MAG TPA: GNAT family N-acetyltransferase [Acidimicrobiia bacterium]|jgi:ribosomal protein S18 acetylase RimI-like enzyme
MIAVIDDASAPEASTARDWLANAPVANNLVLTMIAVANEFAVPFTMWVARDDAGITGVAMQSPRDRDVVLSTMAPSVAADVARASSPTLPGVIGEAAAAAAFAGAWTERHDGCVDRLFGQRFYELTEVRSVVLPNGTLRVATTADLDLAVEWADAFVAETGTEPMDARRSMASSIGAQRLWMWDHGAPCAMARVAPSAASVTRIGGVFTAPERRNRGYGSALVAELSRRLRDRNERCVLFTQLSNATSNAIYRRIGYEAVTEVIGYSFATAAAPRGGR